MPCYNEDTMNKKIYQKIIRDRYVDKFVDTLYALMLAGLIVLFLLIARMDWGDYSTLVTVDISLDMFGLFIGLIMYASCMNFQKGYEKTLTLYMLGVFLDTMAIIADTVSWLTYGNPSLRLEEKISNSAYYILGVWLAVVIWHYEKGVLPLNNKLERFITKLMHTLATGITVAVILNWKLGFFFTIDAYGFYSRQKWCYIFGLVSSGMLVIEDIYAFCVRKPLIKKWPMICMITIPIFFSIQQQLTYGISITVSAGMAGMVLVYCSIQTERMNELAVRKKELAEQRQLISQHEAEISNLRMKAMLSQMQPHVTYNGMVAIRRLITKDPQQAVEAMDHFMGFLRGSIDTMESEQLIPVSQALKFTEDYLEIEKVRFGENISYEIYKNETDFLVPPLSIQPIVENAVRHGLRPLTDRPGQVLIETGCTDKDYFVEITDNGVGYDPEEKKDPEGPILHKHIGLSNVKRRLELMVGGTLQVQTEKGKGTTVTILIPIGENKDENHDH